MARLVRKTINNKIATTQMFLLDTLKQVIEGIDPQSIIADINSLPPIPRVAAFIKLNETYSKINRDISQIKKDEFFMGVDETDKEELIVTIANDEVQVLRKSEYEGYVQTGAALFESYEEEVEEEVEEYEEVEEEIETIEDKQIQLSYENENDISSKKTTSFKPKFRKKIGY